ncbi:Macrolide export protein MacA [subsurface metagenome]
MKKIIYTILMACILIALTVTPLGCSSGPGGTEATEYQTATVQRGDITVDITASGNLELSDKRSLSFGTSGTVGEVLVEEGDSITKGQVLAGLDAPQLEINVALAQLELGQTIYPHYSYTHLSDVSGTWLALDEVEDSLTEMQQLLDEGKIGEVQSSLDQAKLAVDKAKEKAESRVWSLPLSVKRLELQLDKAEAGLDEARITAPFDGIVTKVNVDAGQGVNADTVVMEVARATKFEVDILVSEMDIFQVGEGENATVQIDALPGMNLPAQVTYISPTATIASGVVNYEVKVEIQPLEAVAQKRLREGLSVIVNLPEEERDDVLLVPNSAITTQGGQTYVQVVLPDGTAEERIIGTGISNWQYTEVTSGLSEGEQVVVPDTMTPQQEGSEGQWIPGMGPHQ